MNTIERVGKSIKNFTDRNDPVVLIKERENFSFTFFVIGAMVGLIGGLMFTPDTGENNRAKLKEKLKDLQQDDANPSGSKSYRVTGISEEGVTNLEQERKNLTTF